MKQNMGSADKAIRFITAAIIAALYITGSVTGTKAIVLMAVATVFSITALIGICPLYLPFKISTKNK